MKEAIAILIVMLMGAFAATSAQGYSLQELDKTLSPVYQHIESQNFTPQQGKTLMIEILEKIPLYEDNIFVKQGLINIFEAIYKKQVSSNSLNPSIGILFGENL